MWGFFHLSLLLDVACCGPQKGYMSLNCILRSTKNVNQLMERNGEKPEGGLLTDVEFCLYYLDWRLTVLTFSLEGHPYSFLPGQAPSPSEQCHDAVPSPELPLERIHKVYIET